MKKTMLTAGFVALLLVAAGCQGKDAQSSAPTEKQTTQETKEKSAPSPKTKDGMPYMTPILTLTKDHATLYKNETGSIEYVGSTENQNAANYSVALRATGDVAKADMKSMQFDLITNKGVSIDVRYSDLASVRVIKGEKYFVYDTEEEIGDSRIVRIDGTIAGDDLDRSEDSAYEKGKFSVDIKPSKKTWELEGTKFPMTLHTMINDTRKNELGTVKILSIESEDTNSNSYIINGTITLKKDLEEKEKVLFSALQPDIPFSEDGWIEPDEGDNFFRNAETSFTRSVDMNVPLAANQVEDLYFTVLGETFAYNVRTGKEIKNPDISRMPFAIDTGAEPKNQIFGGSGVDGVLDVAKKCKYNVTEIYDYTSLTPEEIRHVVMPYATGGYKTLTFNIGTDQDVPADGKPYEVVVYGSDFKDLDDSGAKGTVLWKKTITKDTPFQAVKLDVSKQAGVTIFADTKIRDNGYSFDLPFLPLAVSDVTLKK